MEREKEIREFVPKASFKLDGIFLNAADQEIAAKLKKDFDKEQDAEKFIELARTTEFKVLNVETKPGTRSASAPFTTSTLQQEASSRLGYNVTTTMRLAQRLYEEGFITYMRTDSVNLSQEAIEGAKTDYFRIRSSIFFTTKLYHKIIIRSGSSRGDPSYGFRGENGK